MARKHTLDRAAFQERLRALIHRQHHGNRRAFEQSIGLSHTTVVGWFRPARRATLPGAESLAKLVRHFGVTADWLLFGEKGRDQLGADLRDYLAGMLAARGLDRAIIHRALPSPRGLLATTVSVVHRQLELREGERQQIVLRRMLLADGEKLDFRPEDLDLAPTIEVRLGLTPLSEDELDPDRYLADWQRKRRGR